MKIGVTSKSFSKNVPLIEYLGKYFPKFKLNHASKLLTHNELIEFAHDCDGLILALEQIDASVLKALPDLKVLSKFGVGLDNVDKEACSDACVEILWTPGVNRGSAAEMALGFMLMMLRNITVSSNLLAQGIWQKQGGISLYGRTVGIVGLGNIGKELVRILQPFSCRILVNDLVYDDEFCTQYGLDQVTKQELYAESEIISLHVPLTYKTFHLVNDDTINIMKPGVFIINNARGGIVDDNALMRGLINKKIGGAALDVYESEPPVNLDFLGIPNLITTPHIGGNSREAVYAMGKSAVDNLRMYFENRSNDTLQVRQSKS